MHLQAAHPAFGGVADAARRLQVYGDLACCGLILIGCAEMQYAASAGEPHASPEEMRRGAASCSVDAEAPQLPSCTTRRRLIERSNSGARGSWPTHGLRVRILVHVGAPADLAVDVDDRSSTIWFAPAWRPFLAHSFVTSTHTEEAATKLSRTHGQSGRSGTSDVDVATPGDTAAADRRIRMSCSRQSANANPD